MKRISTMIRTAAFLASAAVLFSGITTAAASPARSGSRNTSSQASSSPYIGRERAKEIAAEKYGLRTEDLIFTKVRIDRENGKTVYEIDYYTAEAEYELEIDAISGEIREASEEMFSRKRSSSSNPSSGRNSSGYSSSGSNVSGRYYYDDDWDDRYDDDRYDDDWDDSYDDDRDDRYDDDWDDRYDDDDDDDWDDRYDDDDDDWDDDDD